MNIKFLNHHQVEDLRMSRAEYSIEIGQDSFYLYRNCTKNLVVQGPVVDKYYKFDPRVQFGFIYGDDV